MELSDSLHNCW